MTTPVLVWRELLGMHYATHDGGVLRISLEEKDNEAWRVELDLRSLWGKKWRPIERSTITYWDGTLRRDETWLKTVGTIEEAKLVAVAEMKLFAELLVSSDQIPQP